MPFHIDQLNLVKMQISLIDMREFSISLVFV